MNSQEQNTNEKEIQSVSFSKALSKVSKKGLLVNKRILQLYEGQLKYYNYHKKFVEDDYVPGEFKWGVYVKDIISVEVQGEKKKDRISIEFLAGNMFDKEKRTECSEKQKNNKTRWEFVCSSSEQATQIVEKINLVKKLLDIGERQKKEKEMQKTLQKKVNEGQENLLNQKEKEQEKGQQQQVQAIKQLKQSSSQKQQSQQSSSSVQQQSQSKERRQKQQIIDENEEDKNFKQLRTQIRDYSIKKKEESIRQNQQLFHSPQVPLQNQSRKEESKNTLVNFDQSYPSNSSSAEQNKNITSIAVLQQQPQQSTQQSKKQSPSLEKNQLEGRKQQEQSQESNQTIKEPTKEQKDYLKEQAKLAKKQEKLAKEQAKEQAKEDARIAKEQAKINEDQLKSKRREKDKESEKQQKDGKITIENNKTKKGEEQDKGNESLSEEDLEEKKDVPSPLPQRGSVYPLRKHDLITLQTVETTNDENLRASLPDRLFFSNEDLAPIKQIPLQTMASTPSGSSPLKSHWSVFKQVKNFNIFRQDKNNNQHNNNMSPPDATKSPPTMMNKLSKQSSSVMLSPEKTNETPTDLQKEYLRKLAENSHEFRYHQYLDSNFKETSLTNQLRKGIEVFVFLGKFRKKAIAAAKQLVDDFMLPNQLSSFHPIKGMKDLNIAEEPNNNITNNNGSDLFQPNKSNDNLGIRGITGNNTTRNQADDQQQSASSYQQGYLDEESFFFMADYNMIVRMSWTKLATVIPTYLSDYLNFNEKKGISYYDPQYMKQVGDQFRILKSIAASSLEIRKQDSSYLLRVPLSVIVEYRGFKLLVQAKPSYESNIVYGPNIQKNIYKEYKRNPKFQRQIESDAAKLRSKLRIKPHFFSWKPEIEALECILTFETEIHKSAGDRKTKAALIKYKQEAVLIDQDKEEDQFYIEKYHDFFPINTFLDCQFDERTQRFPRKIRPEILLKRKFPLNPEACFSQIYVGNFKKDNALQKIFSKLIEQQKKDQIDIQEVEEFVGQISGTILHKLIHKFDNLEIIPYDSHTIAEALHSHGLNIKYIAEVARLSKTEQVRLLFEQEMVARAVKNIIRYYLASVTFESKSSLIESYQYPIIHGFHKNESDRKQYYFNRVEEKQKEIVLEILNLTFEQSESGQTFWEQINTQIFLEFGYKQEVSLAQFEEGGLLNAICYCSPFILTYGFDIFNKNNNNEEVSSPRSSPLTLNEGFASQILSDLNRIQNNQPVNTTNKSNLPNNSSSLKSNQTPWAVWENLQKNQVKVLDIATTTQDDKKDTQSQDDSDYQQVIFTMKNLLSFQCESEMFDFSSLQIAQFAEQNLQNDIAEQQQSLLIKDKLSQVLNSDPRERFFTLFSIAKKQFTSGQYEECIESCGNSIQCFDHYPSVLLVDPLCLLIKCYIILNQKPKIMYLFWKTEEIINFNLGKMHPLHCEVLNTMATYYESAGQFEEQIILLKANCHLIEKIVGFRHLKTAQIMFELANVLDEQGMTRQALGYYENVFYMYQAIKGEQNKRSADIGYKIALETFQFNDWERSKKFSTYSLQFYEAQEQSYLSKIVDLKILQFKILKQKKLEAKTEKQDQNNNNNNFGNTSTNTSTINYNNSGINNAINNKENNNNNNNTNTQQINESINEIWQFMRKNDYKEFDQFKELFGVYVDVYLSTLDQEIKHYLSQQFDLIVYELIRINVLDSLQQTANREKSKDILLQEILTEGNNNDPYRLIERTFLIIAEYGSKKSAALMTNEKQENEDQNSPIIIRAKSLFEHMICLLGVNYFKTHFLSFFM